VCALARSARLRASFSSRLAAKSSAVLRPAREISTTSLRSSPPIAGNSRLSGRPRFRLAGGGRERRTRSTATLAALRTPVADLASTSASAVRRPCCKALMLPRPGPGFVPPCILQRRLPVTASPPAGLTSGPRKGSAKRSTHGIVRRKVDFYREMRGRAGFLFIGDASTYLIAHFKGTSRGTSHINLTAASLRHTLYTLPTLKERYIKTETVRRR
jgi:hypothetical protein